MLYEAIASRPHTCCIPARCLPSGNEMHAKATKRPFNIESSRPNGRMLGNKETPIVIIPNKKNVGQLRSLYIRLAFLFESVRPRIKGKAKERTLLLSTDRDSGASMLTQKHKSMDTNSAIDGEDKIVRLSSANIR